MIYHLDKQGLILFHSHFSFVQHEFATNFNFIKLAFILQFLIRILYNSSFIFFTLSSIDSTLLSHPLVVILVY